MEQDVFNLLEKALPIGGTIRVKREANDKSRSSIMTSGSQKRFLCCPVQTVLSFDHRQLIKPIRPVPNISIVEGSGTGAAWKSTL